MNKSQKSFNLFFIIWSGQLLSRIGSGISVFAIGIYLFQQTGITSTYSFFLLCAFLPSVLFALVGGVWADRKDRKLMMVAGDIVSSFGILFTIAMLLFYPEKYWPLYIGIAISSFGAGLHSPAFKASVTDLIDAQAYSKASGLIQLAEASRYLVSPIIAGFLITWFSLPMVLAIDVITFFVAALAVILIRNMTIQPVYTDKKERFIKDFTKGLTYIGNNHTIFRLLYITTFVTFFTGVLQVLIVPIVLSFADTQALGIIQSVAAFGMVFASLFIGVWSTTKRQYTILSWSLMGAGLLYLLIGMSTDTVLFTMTAFCFFLTLPFVNTSLEVLFRQNIANEMQGRIWSLISLISQIGMLVALATTGMLADRLFNPLLTEDGYLAETIGQIIGIGPARGSGLMVIISGIFLVLISVCIRERVRDAKEVFRHSYL
ncbi:MFS transporter [Desulfopila sp. IMCC35008]|uniref:MFS transporter n=1 Tax=Desulfopila sp. IMCC35008 TaxID=2653858 RepID=UPI0013D353D7|nr:MFS transporter [Desulfopila sp. IMCC35008]